MSLLLALLATLHLSNGCDYFYSDPIPLLSDNRIDTITIGEIIEISFELQLNTTCKSGWCTLLRIFNPNEGGYSLPMINIGADTGAIRVIFSDSNSINSKYEISDPYLLSVYPDHTYHRYYFKWSATERIFIFDDIIYMNLTNGSYDTSQYIGGQYGLYISDAQPVLNGTIRNVCINSMKITAKCSDILWNGNVWGVSATGVNLSPYTNDSLKLIVCVSNFNSCPINRFFCEHNMYSSTSITFGTISSIGTLNALLGPGSVPTDHSSCCDSSNEQQLCNAPRDIISVTRLCQQLGYDSGRYTFWKEGSSNSCPKLYWNTNDKQWTSDWTQSDGYAGEYTCYGGLLEGNVRLVNGNIPSEGRLEIYHNDEWGTVCGNRFDIIDAKVVCSQLGYRSGTLKKEAFFGQGTGTVWIDWPNCQGTENRLSHCPGIGYGWWLRYDEKECNHTRDIGISCDTGISCGLNRWCYYVDMYPMATTNITTTLVTIDNSGNDPDYDQYNPREYDIYFKSNGLKCVDPQITFEYEQIDIGHVTENIQVYDESNILIKDCQGNGGDDTQCGIWWTCLNNTKLNVNKSHTIDANDTYRIRLIEGYGTNDLCESKSINARLLITCNYYETQAPTSNPTNITINPTINPTNPTINPTIHPIINPTIHPIINPTIHP
eukprot:252780_1